MNRMVEFNGFQDNPIFIDAERIVAVLPSKGGLLTEPFCIVQIACEKESEEWHLNESVNSVLEKLNTDEVPHA